MNPLCVLLHGETPVKLKTICLSLSKTFYFLLLILSCVERIFCPSGFRCTSSCRPVVSSRRCFSTGTSTVGMVVITSPSFSSYRPCWLVLPLLDICDWLAAAFLCAVLLLVLCLVSVAILWFSLPAVGYDLLLPSVCSALLPSVGSALLGSFILSPLLDDERCSASASSFSTSLSRCPRTRVALLHSSFTTCSLAVVPFLILSPLPLSLILSRDTLW